jgi:hypothetical protein
MAIRRHYLGYVKPTGFSTATFKETVSEDRWHFTHPQTTPRRLKATPQYYQYYAKPLGFSAATFAETVHAVDMPTLDPSVQLRRRFDTPQYPFETGDTKPVVPNINTFKPSNPEITRSRKSTPHLYPFLFDSDFPRVPNPAAFGANEMNPILMKGRLINYMGNYGVIFVSSGRVLTLPLLGVG